MPIIKTTDDYIDECHRALEEHYGITVPKRIVKTMLKQLKVSVYTSLKMKRQVFFPGRFSIYPSLPLSRAAKRKYYGID